MDARVRVVVTGIGTVNASTIGGRDAVSAALARDESPIAPVRAFPVDDLGSRLAAEVDDRGLGANIDPDRARRLSRICLLTVAAAELAARDADVPGGTGLGIAVGTEHGDFRSSEAFAIGFLRRGPSGLSPLTFPNTVMSTMAAVAAIAIEAKGPTVTVNQATVAGDLAIARAVALIKMGRAEAMVAGGADEICEIVYRRLAQMRALSPGQGGGSEGCHPFEPRHNGPILGEGASFVVLEDLAFARARGACILAEVMDAAWGSAPARPHGASPRHLASCGSPVEAVLRRRGVAFRRCYGSGNGDPGLDDWECALLARDLGKSADLVPPLSLAPLFGQHGGLGGLRVGAAALEAGRGPVLVHGIARGGCRTALVLAVPDGGEAS